MTMANPLLLTFLLAAQTLAAQPAGSLQDLVAAQNSRKAACEEGYRNLQQQCGTASPKAREARILRAQAMQRTNLLLDALARELRAGSPAPAALAQEAEAANTQLQAYLELARCDGTTAAPAEGRDTPSLLTRLPGLAGQAGKGGASRPVLDQLEGLRWQAGPAGTTAKGAASTPEALAPRYLMLQGAFHTAPIRQMALDARENLLVTASEDKSLRLWDPRTLTCLRVLRPPMGPGDCGKLYAVALSPDGATVVASGFTRDADGGGHRLYVLDARDGRLIREIPGLPQVVNRLCLSPDGTRVVVHLGERMGLRMYRLSDGAELGRDPLYGGPTYAGAFAADGRYASTSEDGFVRVYGPDFHLLAKARTPGASPFGLAFSPDGATLALGYAEGCRVDLLSAKTLFPAGKPDTTGCQGPLGIVAWSRDGQKLYACGGQDFGPRPNAVSCWTQAGRGPRQETPVASATGCDLLPLKDGGLLVAAQDPRLVRLGADLALAASAATVPSVNKAREGLLVDASGATVALAWRFQDRPEATFSFASLGLRSGLDGLVGPLRESAGLNVQGWRDGEHPTLNGQPIAGLEPHEMVRALSLARNTQSFALGTDWCLRIFDGQGRPAQSVVLPAACWGLNHTPDGKTIVAALADGTLRWYRPDGRELLALTLSPDAQRWVLWNPEGYYDTSVGGEGLLGWQVQREGEAGDFFPLSHFRDPYCQPRLFPALLARGDLDLALVSLGLARTEGSARAQEAALTLPPVLRILEPAEGSLITPGRTAFRVSVRPYGPFEKVKTWHIYLDGEKLPDQAGAEPVAGPGTAEPAEAEYRLEVPLPAHACRVSLVMESAARVSEPAHVNLVEPSQATPAKPPVLNIVSVGISAYRQGGLQLTYPAKDAKDVVDLFQGQRNRLYSNVLVHTLVDGEATRANILKTLKDVRDKSSPWDVTLLFLSGHGLTSPVSGSYCFLPFDADPHDEATLVDGRELRDILARTQGKVVLMLDTCHSGSVLGEGRMRGLDESIKLTRFINELTSADNGVMVFSSSTGRQLSLESPDWGNGAFTKALREGLEGKADPGRSGRVTLTQLDLWLRGRVKDLTQGTQTPVTAKPSTALDFPLVILP